MNHCVINDMRNYERNVRLVGHTWRRTCVAISFLTSAFAYHKFFYAKFDYNTDFLFQSD